MTCADFIPVTTYNFYEGEWYQNSEKFHASESSMIFSCHSPKFANVLMYMYLSASFIYSLSWPCFGHCRVTPQNTGQNKTLNNFNVGEDWSVFSIFCFSYFFLLCLFFFLMPIPYSKPVLKFLLYWRKSLGKESDFITFDTRNSHMSSYAIWKHRKVLYVCFLLNFIENWNLLMEVKPLILINNNFHG